MTASCAALDMSVAAHSPLVEPILDSFGRVVAGVSLARPQIGLVSSMTGSFVADELTEADYWRRHLREPVRFADVFDTLRRAGCTTFVEIGPDQTLLALGRRNWPDAAATWVPSMCRDTDESSNHHGGTGDPLCVGGRGRLARLRPSRRGRAARPPPGHAAVLSVATRVVLVGRGPRGRARSRRRRCGGPLSPPPRCRPRRARSTCTSMPIRSCGRRSIASRVAFVVAALRELGLFANADESHTVGELVDGRHVVDGYAHLVTRWLDHLVDDGRLTRAGDRFVSVLPLADPAVEALIAEAGHAGEGVEPLLDYVARCGDRLAAVVSGRESALEHPVPRRFVRDGRLHLRRVGRAALLQRHRPGRGGGRRGGARRGARCGSWRSAPAPAARPQQCCRRFRARRATRSRTSPSSSSPARQNGSRVIRSSVTPHSTSNSHPTRRVSRSVRTTSSSPPTCCTPPVTSTSRSATFTACSPLAGSWSPTRVPSTPAGSTSPPG